MCNLSADTSDRKTLKAGGNSPHLHFHSVYRDFRAAFIPFVRTQSCCFSQRFVAEFGICFMVLIFKLTLK